jgi:regulatory protein
VRPPRKVSTEEELYTAALRALTRRAHSIFEMRTYLERRAAAPAAAQRVLAHLLEAKLLDDARYALEFARHHARLRRQGRHRISRELRTRGVPDGHIEAAIAQVFAETDETMLVQKVVERRIRALRGPLDQKKTASLYRALLRAGFDTQLIHRELRRALGDATSNLAVAQTEAAEEIS